MGTNYEEHNSSTGFLFGVCTPVSEKKLGKAQNTNPMNRLWKGHSVFLPFSSEWLKQPQRGNAQGGAPRMIGLEWVGPSPPRLRYLSPPRRTVTPSSSEYRRQLVADDS